MSQSTTSLGGSGCAGSHSCFVAGGRVLEVYAAAGDKVRKDDLLVRLRDDEAYERLVQARAEVGVRLGERDEEEEKDQAVIARRKAADALAAAERALHKAWIDLDKVYLAICEGQPDPASGSYEGSIGQVENDGPKKMAVFDDCAPDDKLVVADVGVELASDGTTTERQGDHIAIPFDREEPLRRELKHFLDCCRERTRPETDGDNALRVLSVLSRAERALGGNAAAMRHARAD